MSARRVLSVGVRVGVRIALMLAFMLALTLGVAARLTAQTAPPNCRVWTAHRENPFDYTHYYTQPALAWDVERAALSVATLYAIERLTPLPPVWAAAIPSIGFGLVPHAIGSAQGRYGVSMHWAFTLATSSLPLALVSHDRRTAMTTWLVATTSLVCFDR